ncbi:MAG TPA: hypothetical protein VF729_01015 [Solirubrobacterales bacterium]
MPVDINRIAAAALESLLSEEKPPARRGESGNRRWGSVGAVALGVGLAVGTRAVYNRARRFDLERVAGAIEDKLSG